MNRPLLFLRGVRAGQGQVPVLNGGDGGSATAGQLVGGGAGRHHGQRDMCQCVSNQTSQGAAAVCSMQLCLCLCGVTALLKLQSLSGAAILQPALLSLCNIKIDRIIYF